VRRTRLPTAHTISYEIVSARRAISSTVIVSPPSVPMSVTRSPTFAPGICVTSIVV
jgi:hypothetical protein